MSHFLFVLLALLQSLTTAASRKLSCARYPRARLRRSHRRGHRRSTFPLALGFLSCRNHPPSFRRRNFSAASPALPANSWTPPKPTPTAAHSRPPLLACRVFTIGRSEEGREILMLAIADEAGIRDLDRLKAATAALADPRRTDQAAAEQLIANSRAPFTISTPPCTPTKPAPPKPCSSSPIASPLPKQPMIQGIRSKLVVLINPVSNPDGRDKVVEWFYRYLKGKTDYALTSAQSPPYWSKYAFVDINRDTHQQTHQTTKAVHRMFHEWHPTVVHDLHEGSFHS